MKKDIEILRHNLRGRPFEKPMPTPIPDTPENLVWAILTTPPKDEGDCDYLKTKEREAIAASIGKPPKYELAKALSRREVTFVYDPKIIWNAYTRAAE